MWLDECRALCRRAKYVGEEIAWGERDNHKGTLCAQIYRLLMKSSD